MLLHENTKKMKTEFHAANSRGKADYGWLKATYSFSFANYYDPSRIHFGALRVLNDDYIAGGMGFGKHPHDNMEIITIPLEGAVAHEDSTGTKGIIEAGDVQIMSAGTGIYHSEQNAKADEALRLFQIWIMPKLKNIAPRYDQRRYDVQEFKKGWKTVVAPLGSGQDCLQINQDAYISLLHLSAGQEADYALHEGRQGCFLMNIQGEVSVGDQGLQSRDALSIQDTDQVPVKAKTDAQLMMIEVPMVW